MHLILSENQTVFIPLSSFKPHFKAVFMWLASPYLQKVLMTGGWGIGAHGWPH